MKATGRISHKWILHGFALLSTVAFALLQLYDPAVIREHVESKFYDLRLYMKTTLAKEPTPDNIVIVTIDENSINEYGRWPWLRDTMAGLINGISSGNPSVIAIDILFSEPESPATDNALAKAFDKAGNVILATGFIVNPEQGGFDRQDPEYLWDHAIMEVISTEAIPWKDWVVKPAGVLAPLSELAEVSNIGSVYTQPDRDGVIRWEVLYVHYKDDFYPSMPLQAARMHLGVEFKDMSIIGGAGIQVGDTYIETDLYGRALIEYLGEGAFEYISAADVLSGRVDANIFSDKIVLLGTSAIATYDQKVTPLSANMPGVEKNATVVHDLLKNEFIKKSPGVIEIVLIILSAFVLTYTLRRLSALKGTAMSLAFVFSYVVATFMAFIYKDIWLNVFYPSMNMLTIFTVQTSYKYFLEERKAKNIRNMFSHYVSSKVVDALIANPEIAKIGGQRREVTVLFSDIVGFTTISEKLEPEEIVALLNEYFGAMTDVILHWDGTFDKIVGDEIMCFWGAPIDQPDHVEKATRCTLHMLATLKKLKKKWKDEGKPTLDIGIGLNTGEVLAGNIGAAGKKMDYTIIGDHVNIGARVEALTRDYNTTILITEYTATKLRPLLDANKFGHIDLVSKGMTKVKGRKAEFGIYTLVGYDHDDDDDD